MSDLKALYDEIGDCHRCTLANTRLRTVPGEGPEQPDILFIGEAPGYHENQQGRPFVGQAGRLLEELLATVGLKRGEVYIANVVKCRPPENRDPLPSEIEACRPFLDRQIQLLGPKIIVTLGRFSMAKYFPGETIGRVHGKVRTFKGVAVLPLYHPAAALRQAALRKVLEEDLQRILALLPAPPPPAPAKTPESPTQLGLF